MEVTYPIEINGEKIDIKAYNIDGRTYMSLKDISDNTHLITTWIPDEQKVVIRDGSHIVIKEINGKKYVDMSYWFSRYNPNYKSQYTLEYIARIIVKLSSGFLVCR